ncbi:MAG TPA: DUF5130 family protein [Mycobacteriales bacterium]|nr:DUF5130 family protein [Mycobacteriales bacterium]
MAAGEAFTATQTERIQRALAQAQSETGLRFYLTVGPFSSQSGYKAEAQRLLGVLIADHHGGHDPGVVLVAVDPGNKVLEIATSPVARERIGDHEVGLVVLSMTSSFTVGDLVGGIVNGLRMLADSTGAERAALTA